MEELSFVLGVVCRVIFDLLMAALLLRAALSVFLSRGSALLGVLVLVTEPTVMLFRYLTARMKRVSEAPIDISYCAASAAVALISAFLGMWF